MRGVCERVCVRVSERVCVRGEGMRGCVRQFV